MRSFPFACTLTIALLLAGCRTAGPDVQVTLADGQVLVGRLATPTFSMKTGFGELDFDTRDAGELGLVEGETVKQSGEMVRLWLRNGSEFVGKWQKPAVEVRMSMGGDEVAIQVPIAKLKRLQFRGEAVWSRDPVFRIVTRHGDDFFVDVTRTRMKLGNEMGNFAPFLSEVARLQPQDAEKKQWRVQLGTGTVFLAALQQEQLDLRLAMGPERLKLPLEAVKQMDRQSLTTPPQQIGLLESFASGLSRHSRGFFSNTEQKAAKEAAASDWKK